MAYFEITFKARYEVDEETLSAMYGTSSMQEALEIDIDNAKSDPISALEVADHVSVSGKVKAGQPNLEKCYGCAVEPGTAHKDGCDHARCPDCGQQLLFHDCDYWLKDADGPNRPAMWHGMSPSEEVARQLSWWTTATGLDHPVEDHMRVSVAEDLGHITWNPRTQRYDIHTIDEQAIDRRLAGGR